jgi:hypothetical protein
MNTVLNKSMKTDVNSVRGLLHHVVVADEGRGVGDRGLMSLLDQQEQWTGEDVRVPSVPTGLDEAPVPILSHLFSIYT